MQRRRVPAFPGLRASALRGCIPHAFAIPQRPPPDLFPVVLRPSLLNSPIPPMWNTGRHRLLHTSTSRLFRVSD